MTPNEQTGIWSQAEGGKGGRTDIVHGRGSRHAEQGAETSNLGWRLAGGGWEKIPGR